MRPYLPKKVLQSQAEQGVSVQAEAQRFTSQERATEQKVVQEQSQQAQAQIDQYQAGQRKGVSIGVTAAKSSAWTEEDLKSFREGRKQYITFIEAMKNAQDSKLEAELLVSENYRKTFQSEGDNALEGASKKPIQYVLMRQQDGRAEAVIITQVEAAELQTLLAKTDQDKDPFVWIETPRATLYAGKRPERLANNYAALFEQINYFSGNLSVLDKHFDSNQWFNRDRAPTLCQFFKEHIMRDELIRESSFANFEERILEKARTLPQTQTVISESKERDEKERKEQADHSPMASLLHQYGTEPIDKTLPEKREEQSKDTSIAPLLHQYDSSAADQMPPIERLSNSLQELRQLAAHSKGVCTVKMQKLLTEIENLKNKQGFTLETQMPNGQTLEKEIEGLKRYPVYHNVMAIFKPKPTPTSI